MLNNATIAQLRALKLVGFADALQQQHEQADCLNMSFDERLALLVEREVYARSDRKRVRLLQQAQLKYPSATLRTPASRASEAWIGQPSWALRCPPGLSAARP